MKKQVDLKFRLMLQANVSSLIRALGIGFLLFSLSLIVFITFSVTYAHTNLGVFIGIICLLMMIFSVNLILYILNLSFRTGMIVIMDRKGFVDMASPVQWGLLKIENIDYEKY